MLHCMKASPVMHVVSKLNGGRYVNMHANSAHTVRPHVSGARMPPSLSPHFRHTKNLVAGKRSNVKRVINSCQERKSSHIQHRIIAELHATSVRRRSNGTEWNIIEITSVRCDRSNALIVIYPFPIAHCRVTRSIVAPVPRSVRSAPSIFDWLTWTYIEERSVHFLNRICPNATTITL